jgi:hypothetical protein
MAKMLDAIGINKRRFAKFAQEYLEIPSNFFRNGLIYGEDAIIEYLLEKGVFNLEDLQVEFKIRKIYVSEKRLQKCIKGRIK